MQAVFRCFPLFFSIFVFVAGAAEPDDAARAFARGDLPAARAAYRELLKERPGDAHILANLGTVEFQAGLSEKAAAYLEQSVAANPSLASSWFLLGVIYREDGQLYHAISAFSRAIHEDPRNANAHQMLGLTMRDNDWPDAAETEVRRCLELDPDNADANYNLAVLLLDKKDPDAEMARHHYRRAVELGAKPDGEIQKRLDAALNPKESATEVKPEP